MIVFFTSFLDMSVDLDKMLKELRAAEIDAFKALQNGNAIKQKI